MNPIIKKIRIPLIVVVVIGTIVYFVMKPSEKDSNTSPSLGTKGLTSTVTNTPINSITDTKTSVNTLANTSVLKLLQNIGDINLPTEFFSSKEFSLLSDGTVTIPQRNDPGRRNPFILPFGSSETSSTTPETSGTPTDNTNLLSEPEKPVLPKKENPIPSKT